MKNSKRNQRNAELKDAKLAAGKPTLSRFERKFMTEEQIQIAVHAAAKANRAQAKGLN